MITTQIVKMEPREIYLNRIDKINKLGSIPVIVNDDCMEDNLGIALATYFEGHPDRPENDPEHPEYSGWTKWAIEKVMDLENRILDEVESWDEVANKGKK